MTKKADIPKKKIVVRITKAMQEKYERLDEGFWSWLNRGIRGTHVWVSKKYLQNYVNEFAFRYNQRHNGNHMFFTLLDYVAKPSQ